MIALAGVSRARDGDADKPAKPFTPGQVRFYETEVRPILKAHCLKCHGDGPKIRGDFRLDSRAAVLRGGELGPAVSLREPEKSRLLEAIRYEDLEMPPAGKLPAHEIDVLTRWVKDGLPWTGESKTAAGVPPIRRVPAKTPAPRAPRDAWSFRPVRRPALPVVKDRGWCRSPIDVFLLSRLEAEGLQPAPPADRVTLIRRLTYDLTGLPPTPREVDAFLADHAVGAYEHLVDRLLASPHYGEKWGRHWLDLVRYGETDGYERDSAKPFAWRYRDYVIAALNEDKPFDHFIREQLAGDEIDPDSAGPLIATGYYRLGIRDDEPADRLLAHYDGLDGIISTTGQVILGMSINCARCHDHKVDPIPQRDYYRLLAFFGDVTDSNGKDLRKVAGGSGTRIDVMCVAERGRSDMHVLLRGNPNLRGDKVEPGVPEVLGDGAPTFVRGPGKRRALADWLTDRRNPRTARVLANRLWQYHFGRGIVPTPNDFGGLGEPPTHPELLDWLAADLMDGDWHLKRMHRLIVLSSAYRMSSRGRAAALALDPANRWFWRFPMRRLTGEEVRDSILAVAGTLNVKAGGPSVYPPIPREVLAGQSVPGQGWPTSSPAEAARRSIYVHVKRSLLVPILATHDAADTDSSCPVRYSTTVPTQALGLLNGTFTNEQAARFAGRLRREAPGDVRAQVRRALRLTTAREPDAGEVRDDVALLDSLAAQGRLDARTALTQYCLMTLNANAFLYLD
ncbi:MAG: PSD1 and planctomycete cytochrome C domain-containing protein [Candidatus Limnocylindrales bacterium]